MKEFVFMPPEERSGHVNASLLNDSNYAGEDSVEMLNTVIDGEIYEVTVPELAALDAAANDVVLIRTRVFTNTGVIVWTYI